jgi:glutamate carboxypeptidase
MSDLQARVLDWLTSREGEMADLLRDLVNADGGTYDKEGVDRAGAVLTGFWAAHGIPFRVTPVETLGDILRADLAGPGDDPRPILLLGHRDTVFPKGEAQRRPFRVEDGRAYGPGVADMKGGLAMEAFVMAAFAACGAPVPLAMLVTSDEEIASPACGPAISEAAKGARAVFNAEPSRRADGTAAGNARTQVVTKGRKGGVFLRMEATGKAAHSGARYQDGRSAILDLAQKVAPLHALTDLDAGITVNVGLIGGGQTVNTVAPSAWAEIDLRYVEPAQRDAVVARIREIAETPLVDGVTARLQIKGEFRPLVQTDAARDLLDVWTAAAARFGVDVSAGFTGGCADSGLTAAAGCPTLCSVGPVGGHAHTPDEFLEMESLLTGAKTLAVSILTLAARTPARAA